MREIGDTSQESGGGGGGGGGGIVRGLLVADSRKLQ